MPAAIAEKRVVARMPCLPADERMRREIVDVILLQLFYARARHIQKLQFHFRRRDAVRKTLHDVLLAASRGLHHLIHRAVAVFRQEAAAKRDRHLVENDALAVVVEVFPLRLVLQDRHAAPPSTTFAVSLPWKPKGSSLGRGMGTNASHENFSDSRLVANHLQTFQCTSTRITITNPNLRATNPPHHRLSKNG